MSIKQLVAVLDDGETWGGLGYVYECCRTQMDAVSSVDASALKPFRVWEICAALDDEGVLHPYLKQVKSDAKAVAVLEGGVIRNVRSPDILGGGVEIRNLDTQGVTIDDVEESDIPEGFDPAIDDITVLVYRAHEDPTIPYEVENLTNYAIRHDPSLLQDTHGASGDLRPVDSYGEPLTVVKGISARAIGCYTQRRDTQRDFRQEFERTLGRVSAAYGPMLEEDFWVLIDEHLAPSGEAKPANTTAMVERVKRLVQGLASSRGDGRYAGLRGMPLAFALLASFLARYKQCIHVIEGAIKEHYAGTWLAGTHDSRDYCIDSFVVLNGQTGFDRFTAGRMKYEVDNDLMQATELGVVHTLHEKLFELFSTVCYEYNLGLRS